MNIVIIDKISYILFNISYLFLILCCINLNYRIKKLEKALKEKENKGKHIKLFEGDSK